MQQGLEYLCGGGNASMTRWAHSSWVQDLPWPEVEARMASATALLPVGAAAKEHGPHLVHGADYAQAVHYAQRVADTLDCLVWPVVSYGCYPVFVEYPGSISISRETFSAVVSDIIDGITHAGATRIAILNTGISTIEPLRQVAEARMQAPPVRLVNCYDGPRFTALVAELQEQSFGGHADEIETSLMLAIDPAGVALDLAPSAGRPIERGILRRHDAASPNYSPSGVNGDPRLASRAKGRRLQAALIADLIAVVTDFADA